MENNYIFLNSVPQYSHVDSKWLVEDKSFMPKIINSETNHIAEWTKTGRSFRTANVTKGNGKHTSVSSDVIYAAYERRHVYDL